MKKSKGVNNNNNHNKSLTEEKIQRGIFQGDALSPLLFVIAMMPFNHTLRKGTGRCKLHKSQEKSNHLMYIDDIKLFDKNKKELEIQMQSVRIYNQDIGMEFGRETCPMLIMKSGKRHRTEGTELRYQDKIRTIEEKETYKYLGILGVNTVKHAGVKEIRIPQEKEEYSRNQTT